MPQTTEVPGKPGWKLSESPELKDLKLEKFDMDEAVKKVLRATIATMKIHVKKDAEELRLLKFCRRTKHDVHPSRVVLMRKFRCRDGADVSREIWRRKHQATVRLIAYGRLRKKSHVKDDSRWDHHVKALIESYAPVAQW